MPICPLAFFAPRLPHFPEDLEAAANNYNCETLSHCVKKDAYSVDTEWFGGTGGWAYSGATFGRDQGFTFSANFTPRVLSVSPEYGLPGQLVEIKGINLAQGTAVTDTNWYMSEFGFYYQPYTASVTIGSSECQLVSHNETMITCNAVYGGMYKPLDVVVTVHGKGDADVDANFTFALNMYDLTPRQGSLAGGTVMTVRTSSLTDSKDLGVTTYSVNMIPNENSGMFKYIAAYLGETFAVTGCEVNSTGSESVTCVTGSLSGGVFSDPMAVADRDLYPWLVAEWNSKEIYSSCADTEVTDDNPTDGFDESCRFSFAKRYTPVLRLLLNDSEIFLNQDVAANFVEEEAASDQVKSSSHFPSTRARILRSTASNLLLLSDYNNFGDCGRRASLGVELVAVHHRDQDLPGGHFQFDNQYNQ